MCRPGEQVGSERDSLELQAERRGKRAHGRGLREAGDAFEEYVAVGHKRDQQPVDELFLSHEDLVDFGAQAFERLRLFGYGAWGVAHVHCGLLLCLFQRRFLCRGFRLRGLFRGGFFLGWGGCFHGRGLFRGGFFLRRFFLGG